MADDSKKKTQPDSTAQDEASTQQPREEVISTAIKFLQNPKVRESPFAQRRAFLEKKGLTKAEIDIAIARSGTAADETAVIAAAPQYSGPVQQYSPPAAPVYTTWQRTRDIASTAVLIGGLGYAAYSFFKRYIAPHWFAPSKQEQQLAALEKSISELRSTLDSLAKVAEVNQKSLSEQTTSITDMVRNTAGIRGPSELQKIHDTQWAGEVKEEIRSLKALMLSRSQFPTTPSSKPVLPSWQRLTPEQGQQTPSGAPNLPAGAPDQAQLKQSQQPSSLDTPSAAKNPLVEAGVVAPELAQVAAEAASSESGKLPPTPGPLTENGVKDVNDSEANDATVQEAVIKSDISVSEVKKTAPFENGSGDHLHGSDEIENVSFDTQPNGHMMEDPEE